MRDIKRNFRHFHDYYSRTYPRYESYTSVERENDLYQMIKSEIQNNNVIFEHNLYYDISGNINQKFKTNVLCCIGDSISSELSGPIIQEVIMILSSPEAAIALSSPVINIVTESPIVKANTVSIVGTAISDDTLSSQMFIATEKSIGNPEISSVMKKPVANVLPSQEVSSVVASVAANGITIEKIIGNNGLSCVDTNKNEIPDEYDDNLVTDTIIFGGLGA